MTDQLFESTSAADDLVAYPDKSKDWLTELVGEGKKFADEKALAYAKAQSDAFIEQLQKENARLRGELTGKKTLDDVLTAIEKKAKQPEVGTQPTESADGNKLTPEVLDEVLNKKLSAAVSNLKKESQAEANVNRVVSELTKTWGKDYAARLEQETKKLDLGKDFVTQLARERPEALLVLLGVKGQEQSRTVQSPASTVNTQGMPTDKFSGEKTLAYYQKLKKENRAKYESPAIQNEMHAQALKLREAFFDV